jgi:rod shape-determining protein MreC
MRNLLNFIFRFHVAFLFLLLEVLGFFLLISYNNYHNIRAFSITNEVSGEFYGQVNEATSYLNLRDVNEQLSRENAALREMVRSSYLDTSSLFKPVFDTARVRVFEYLPAEVINGSVNKRNNYLIIDRGSSSGVKREMGVISPNGVAGVVVDVSPNYASVMSLLHGRSQVSTVIEKNGFFGLLKWDGSDPRFATLVDIPAHVDIAEGDTLLTRGASGIFPKNQLVGTIESWEINQSNRFYEIKVNLATDFRRLQHVHLVKNSKKQEIDTLIQNSTEPDV